jgi:hypothetical protein
MVTQWNLLLNNLLLFWNNSIIMITIFFLLFKIIINIYMNNYLVKINDFKNENEKNH